MLIFNSSARDKAPATDHGCKDATTDRAQIAAWWDGTYLYNVGIATGGGLVVLDVDVNHAAGKYGDETLAELDRVTVYASAIRWLALIGRAAKNSFASSRVSNRRFFQVLHFAGRWCPG